MSTFAQSCLLLSGLALAAAPVPPNVQVRVTCPVDLACPGMKVVFRATVQGAPTGVCQCSATGWSVGPWLTFTVRATSVHDDKAWAEASILAWGGPVMLSGVTELINAYARPVTWATPCALGGRPFLDPETGAPFLGSAAAPARPDPLGSPWLPDQMVGYGRPARLQVGGAQDGDWAFRCPIVVADAGNHAIRLVDAAGQVTTLAGNGKPGYLDTNGPPPPPSTIPRGWRWTPRARSSWPTRATT